ncbi:hypothetical protein SAMN06297358_3284 [Pedobacter xixiisoli]|uniref:Uncharacterized protein n=1 Tax=Pedobacter xixiisoli TaxID=1476464 RepID=A0A286AAQ0_9SPHI|nr:hypothetical protein SAMN06297358_3284 [Pedobacter xixiisoli]
MSYIYPLLMVTISEQEIKASYVTLIAFSTIIQISMATKFSNSTSVVKLTSIST